MELSVIVCTYDAGRLHDLDECIQSLLKQSYDDFEVIIVVDHSQELFRIVSAKYAAVPKVKVFLNNSSRGLSGSLNLGISYARSQIVCFTDDDAIATEDWLKELVSAYDDDTYGVGGRTECLWMVSKPVYLPEEFYWMIGATGNFLPNRADSVRNLWSGNVSYNRIAFRKAGLFLQSLGMTRDAMFQGEDSEFGIRLLKATGKSLKYNPNAIVYHKVRGHRVNLVSLLRRAYLQGYSKALIAKLHGETYALSTERGYLRLLARSIPTRLRRLVSGSTTIQALEQLFFTFLVCATVLLGFAIGLKAYPVKDYGNYGMARAEKDRYST